MSLPDQTLLNRNRESILKLNQTLVNHTLQAKQIANSINSIYDSIEISNQSISRVKQLLIQVDSVFQNYRNSIEKQRYFDSEFQKDLHDFKTNQTSFSTNSNQTSSNSTTNLEQIKLKSTQKEIDDLNDFLNE